MLTDTGLHLIFLGLIGIFVPVLLLGVSVVYVFDGAAAGDDL